jgi:di/tricarboxylate transporter
MPMSFGALLGGIVTLVGTSPNIIVSRVREQILGAPYGMFDFAPVGAGIAVAGFLFLIFGWRLLPHDRKGAASMDAAFNLEGYITEVTVSEDTPAVGVTVKALEELGENEIEVIALVRGSTRRHEPAGNVVVKAGDILILQGEPSALERVVALEKLKLTRDHKTNEGDTPADERGVMEAVITPDSELVGSSVGQLKLFDRHGVNLLAVSRKGRRIAHRLRAVKLKAGDVIVLQGNLTRDPWRAALSATRRTRSPHWQERQPAPRWRARRGHGARRLQSGTRRRCLFRRGGSPPARGLASLACSLRCG